MPEIDERERPPRRPGELGLEIQTQAMEDRRGDIRRLDGPVGRDGTDGVAGPDHAASLDASPGETDTVKQSGQWSRPPAGLTRGVRPNSARLQTSVESSIPR